MERYRAKKMANKIFLGTLFKGFGKVILENVDKFHDYLLFFFLDISKFKLPVHGYQVNLELAKP